MHRQTGSAFDLRPAIPVFARTSTVNSRPTSARRPISSSGVEGQDRERTALQWRDGTEMSLVEGHDLIGPIAVRDHDQRAVGEPKLEIRIACVELSDRGIVLALETGDGKSSGGEIGDEISPWPTSNPSR